MPLLSLNEPYKPAGDQPEAIRKLTEGLKTGTPHQTLLGVTGSGKTFTMANVIANIGRPTLVISHNKTLAAQLYQEFRNFFPKNAVHYFVSYYDYYQPEAYIPQSDTYIEKDAKINDFIDAMRHATTASALSRNDLVIIASVSCIYGIGDPEEYRKAAIELKEGQNLPRKNFLQNLVALQYARNDYEKFPGTFRVRGEAVEILNPSAEGSTIIEWDGNVIERISSPEMNGKSGFARIFPAKHFVTPQEKLAMAIANIELELKERLSEFKTQEKPLEAERLRQRTRFDLKMLKETGYTHGIENYSRQLSFRKAGEPPSTLLDYLPKNFVTFIDESHMSVPQIRGMYNGDRARKQTLIDYGFRLPSAADNRPLKFEEFLERVGQTVYVSATPAEYEFKLSGKENVAEQIIRPTGLLDPKVEVKDTKILKEKIMEDVIGEINKRVLAGERVLVTTLTKRTAEDLADFLKEENIKAAYIHSDIKTMERPEILTDLRLGKYDVVVGINLLREGLDLPEVSLVIILDADKEGFLRNAQTLIQTMGRAARHTNGKVLMYADKITESMKKAMEETDRRREIQDNYNKSNHTVPMALSQRAPENIFGVYKATAKMKLPKMSKSGSTEILKKELEKEMLEEAKALNFERAAELRDMIKTLHKK